MNIIFKVDRKDDGHDDGETTDLRTSSVANPINRSEDNAGGKIY